MGLFEKLFPKKAETLVPEGYFKTLTAYAPVFTTSGGALYESELVRAAIDARARHISKLKVEVIGSGERLVASRLRKAPNSWQTWGQFLYRLSTILDCEGSAFILPECSKSGEIVGYFPVLPSQCKLMYYKNGTECIQYEFKNGQKGTLPLDDVGIMTKFQYESDIFGSNNRALTPTMALIGMQNQGIEEGIKSAATYRFMAQVNNFTKPEDLKKERERFSRENFQSEGGGVLLFPNTYTNIKQIDAKPFVVDAEQMKLINERIYNYFGVNEDVLQNKAFGDAWSAFYEGAIEPFSIQFSDVMTKMVFTDRERGYGNNVMATANRLQYMSNTDKLNVSAQLADRGIMNRNEIREIWNLPPIDGGDEFILRGEYYGADQKLNEEPQEDNNDG